MAALPEPAPGRTLADLRGLLNVREEGDFRLIVGWLLDALNPTHPFPALSLSGEQGSAKSTAAKTLRQLIDPSDAPLRSVPRDEDALMVHAQHSHVVALGNVSGLSQWTSDALCKIATGVALTKRAHYENAEEIILKAKRPIILNGIEDAVTRPDLADRSIVVVLEPIGDADRRTEAELAARFDAAAPRVLGLLLDAAARGLRRLPDVREPALPRMADFARWAIACGDGELWPEGGFVEAYAANRARAVEDVVAADPIADGVRALADVEGVRHGTIGALLAKLTETAPMGATKGRDWPSTARGLSGRLRRVAPPLRRLGVDVRFDARTKHGRYVTVCRGASEKDLQRTVTTVTTVTSAVKSLISKDGEGDGRVTVGDGRNSPTVINKSNRINAGDGGDGVSQLYSKKEERRVRRRV